MFNKLLALIILFLCILSSIIVAEDYKIETVYYPEEILIQKGWMKYFNVIVENKGELILNNISVSFDGNNSQWFEVQANKTDSLHPNNNASFLVKLEVPSNATSKAYSFNLYARSKEAIDKKPIKVNVFESESDHMLYQVQNLELKLEDVKRNATTIENQGTNVTGVRSVLIEAENYISVSKGYIKNNEFNKATKLILDIENLLTEAEFDLTLAPTNPELTSSDFPYEVLLIPAALIIVVLIVLVLRKNKVKTVENEPTGYEPAGYEPVRYTPKEYESVDKIKEIVLEGKDIKNMENDLKEIENSMVLLEEEYKGNLISQESYDELKSKYENRINQMKESIERNKAI